MSVKQLIDLGAQPLPNRLLHRASEPVEFYPLLMLRCGSCAMAWLADTVDPALMFRQYTYFSSYSDQWLEHLRGYATIARGWLHGVENPLVVEIGSNDGSLLVQLQTGDCRLVGIEPAENIAAQARCEGLQVFNDFFDQGLAHRVAQQHGQADLIITNNVLAHVPDLDEFAEGLRVLLARNGRVTVEFAHVYRLLRGTQFDTIYHEHASYLSCHAACCLFHRHQLRVFHVEEIPTHGGSLRLHVCHAEDDQHTRQNSVDDILSKERKELIDNSTLYRTFNLNVRRIRKSVRRLIKQIKKEGAVIAAYGAAAKGAVFLNYCGLGPKDIPFIVDRSPHKQGLFVPGCRIPIYEVQHLKDKRPDYLLILPWNCEQEVKLQCTFIRDWGGRFVVAIPEVRIERE